MLFYHHFSFLAGVTLTVLGVGVGWYSGYRLANGSTRCSGRVELRHGGTWGTLCDSQWDLQGAHTLCQQNDCGFALSIPSEQLFGTGDGYVWNGTFGCERNESRLRDCPVTALGTTECPPGNEASVVCSGCLGGRLVNGTECSGRVEIRHGDTWGSLCASHWDLQDANVLCHQLNCGYAKSIQGGAHFGEGNGTIWSDTFHCEGTESCLWNCSRMALGNPACSPRDTARVICSGRSEALRLLYGESRCNGTVEIFLHGMWSRVLDDQWDMRDASVVCRQLQCGVAEKAYNPSKSERGRGPVGQILTGSTGSSYSFPQPVPCACFPSLLGREFSLPSWNGSVSCCTQPTGSFPLGSIPAGSMQIRLVNGTGRCAGRVEIYYNGSWGTVCDDFWDLSDSNVVCKQLGCGHAINATISAHYGEGSGQIWLDDVNCSGNESELWECPSRVWGQHNCRHKEDAGVLCSEFTDLRLVSDSECAGRLEVFYNGTWGSVCSNGMPGVTAAIVCKQLNCGDRGQLARDFAYGAGSGPTWLDHVSCKEQHSSIWQCPSDMWKQQSCDNRAEENHISCSDQEKLQVVGGEDRCSGRVEVWYRDSWGTICDDSWDMADAKVVCKQLGCGSAVPVPGEAAFGEGTGPIWVETLNCRGTESSLWDCPAKPWDESNCDHKEDVGVNCSGEEKAMNPKCLVGGDTACSGRVEVRRGNTWETVCDSHLDFKAATVICSELGCGQVVAMLGAADFGEGHDLIWKEKFQCVGNEPLLTTCTRMSHPSNTCSHADDVGVLCSGYGGYRLAKGSTRCSGRVELHHGGTWGTFCDSQWDLQTAHTLCQQLNCGFAMSMPAERLFGTGDGPVWNGTFACERNESRLRDCLVTALGTTQCPPESEASVVCSGEQLQWERKELGIGNILSQFFTVCCLGGRLVNGTECSGRVEIRHGDTWGSLCASHWDLQDANVLCRQLNCGYAESIQGGAHFGEGSGTIWSDGFHCEGTESCLWNCSRMALGKPACSPRDTARVICSGKFIIDMYMLVTVQCTAQIRIFTSSPIDYYMNDASVVCRQLQCGVAEKAYNPPKSEQGTGPVGLRRVQCAGNETRLTLCDNSTSETHVPPLAPTCRGRQGVSAFPDQEKLRVMRGEDGCSGRVEVWYRGSWGTVCDDSWDMADAKVVCKQLGCGSAVPVPGEAAFGEGTGPIWVESLNCRGTESSLWDCPAKPWGESNCDHKEDVGVNCSGVRMAQTSAHISAQGDVSPKSLTHRPSEQTLQMADAKQEEENSEIPNSPRAIIATDGKPDDQVVTCLNVRAFSLSSSWFLSHKQKAEDHNPRAGNAMFIGVNQASISIAMYTTEISLSFFRPSFS
uniref:SRCR domain-containing protein n=1 Tax=Chelonoidis abingdonii TaxID=106734 RepID=A0A8C0HAD1_CHEAB